MGKKKPTIGYWYKSLYHLGICRGPVDALLEFRGGDKTAWKGVQTESGIIAIDALELWGGEKKEGGIRGDLHVMMGEATQSPNAMLAAELGPEQSAYRGRTTMAFNGRYGAFNPYPKPPWFKMRRILKGWDDDTCWYPEKAPIVLSGSPGLDSVLLVTQGTNGGSSTQLEEHPLGFASIDWDLVPDGKIQFTTVEPGTTPGYEDSTYPRRHIFYVDGVQKWDSGWYGLPADQDALTDILVAEGRLDLLGPIAAGLPSFVYDTMGSEPAISQRGYVAVIADARPNIFTTLAHVRTPGTDSTEVIGMNPAHILYDSITSADMKGEPVELVNDASFTAAADLFYEEAFGLCTTYDAGSESVEQFQQRILNVIGANLSQSRTDGQYYLTPVRGNYVLDDLPILEDDDILEYSEEPSDPLESVNQVAVEWFDQVTRTKRTTTPLQALGAIQAVGAVLADTSVYPEIASETLALRCAARDLAQKSTPLKRMVLTTTRKTYAWRAGDFFRLQAPRRGIADMVCMLGEIGAGVRRSGSIRIRAIQDVSGMPTTTYVEAEPGIDTSPSQTPTAPPAQAAVEAPYVELVTSIPTAELAALAPDSGFVSAFAARPASGVNFDLWTSTGSEAYEDRGDGDWCPYAKVVEAAGPTETAFTLSDAQDMDEVLVGQAALWDGEIVRVTAVDADAGTIALARGCADTTPAIEHAAGQDILFFGSSTSSDEREYTDGETVLVRMLSRTSSALYPLESAATETVVMASRAARPYPPGKLRITDDLVADAAYPVSALGELEVTWAHRDRVLQEDQLIDESAPSIGPEAGTTYTVRYYVDAVIDHTESGITGTAATPHTLGSDGTCLVEVEAVRDGLVSWQPARARFSYLVTALEPRITDSSDTRITDSGDRRTTD